MKTNPLDVVREFYSRGTESRRLFSGQGILERQRTMDVLSRFLPKPPSIIYDLGGGAGVYAIPLAKAGYEVHLLDLTPLHIKQAHRSARRHETHIAEALVGDARALPFKSASADAVLLMGPLYHLQSLADRKACLKEARRVLKPGGIIIAAAISRYASYMDGVYRSILADQLYTRSTEVDLKTGRHEAPKSRPYFTTAYFHHPDELKAEMSGSGFSDVRLIGVEGPCWSDPDIRKLIKGKAAWEAALKMIASFESEQSIIGASAHLLAIGTKNR